MTASERRLTASSIATTARATPAQFFLGPNHDVVVEPVPRCVGPGNPPKHEPITYGAFTLHLLTLNFAHRQAGGSGEYAG